MLVQHASMSLLATGKQMRPFVLPVIIYLRLVGVRPAVEVYVTWCGFRMGVPPLSPFTNSLVMQSLTVPLGLRTFDFSLIGLLKLSSASSFISRNMLSSIRSNQGSYFLCQ